MQGLEWNYQLINLAGFVAMIVLGALAATSSRRLQQLSGICVGSIQAILGWMLLNQPGQEQDLWTPFYLPLFFAVFVLSWAIFRFVFAFALLAFRNWHPRASA